VGGDIGLIEVLACPRQKRVLTVPYLSNREPDHGGDGGGLALATLRARHQYVPVLYVSWSRAQNRVPGVAVQEAGGRQRGAARALAVAARGGDLGKVVVVSVNGAALEACFPNSSISLEMFGMADGLKFV
jgi:hypothetical protein